jgi:hypothetical protein
MIIARINHGGYSEIINLDDSSRVAFHVSVDASENHYLPLGSVPKMDRIWHSIIDTGRAELGWVTYVRVEAT